MTWSDQIVGVNEAAEIIGRTVQRVRQLVVAGEIEAVKLGREWAIRRSSCEAWRDTRRPALGRPRKVSSAG